MSWAQKKGDTKIVLETNLSEDDLYKNIGQTLVEKGWSIAKTDPNFKTIETRQMKYKSKSGYNTKHIIYVSVKGSKAVFSSKIKAVGVIYP